MRRSPVLGAVLLAALGGGLVFADGRPDAPPEGPVAFKPREGKAGWKVTLPGRRPLATPAVVGGKVFLGGGFGSHEFHALDAKTGQPVWVHRTDDDGPGAAAVENG